MSTLAAGSSGTAEFARLVLPWPNRSSQPSEPLVLDARPAQRGGVLEVADLGRCAPARPPAAATDTTSAAAIVDDVAALGRAPHGRGATSTRVPDHVAHRWHRTRRQAVPQADPGADGGQLWPCQCPNGSGSSPGVHFRPGTPQPFDFTVRFAARACLPISLSM